MDSASLVDYAASLDCIHCGLCLSSCPTYRLTGREASSPRGRVFLMRAVAEERIAPGAAYSDELDFCLVCRACESACPAGVRFGEMMETARDAVPRARSPLARLAHSLGFGLLERRRALRAALTALGLLQRLGLVRLAAALAGARGSALRALPRVPPLRERRPLPASTPAEGRERGRAILLEGCVMPELYGRVQRATLRVLARAGWRVLCPRERSACCGALHAHNGELEASRALARATIAACEAESARAGAGEPPAIVSNSAGCGAHMKAYGRLLASDPEWAERAARFAARVADFSELLAPRAAELGLRLAAGALPGPVAWDDPCHLCHAQGLRAEPRALLDLVRGLARVELEDSEACCGSAGIYSLLRPEASAAIFAEKLASFERSGAALLVTANPGCQLQWAAGFARAGRAWPVLHLAEVLARALPDVPAAPANPR